MPAKYWLRVPDLSSHDANYYVHADGSLPLFDIQRYTRNFEKSCQAMWDIYKTNVKPMNIIVDPQG